MDGFICFTEQMIYYNFPIESNMYRFNKSNHLIQTFGGKSQYTKNQAGPELKMTMEAVDKYKIENIHFHEPIFDPYRNLIYRIHVKEMDMVYI